MIARAALLLVFGWSVGVASADPTSELTISKSCRDFLHKRMLAEPGALLVLGHLYVAQDSATGPSVCGWSASSPYGAFMACGREAAKRGVAGPCLPMVKDSVVVASSARASCRSPSSTSANPVSASSLRG